MAQAKASYDENEFIVKIANVRLSYPHLFEPFAGKAEPGKAPPKPKYSAVGMLDKKDPAQVAQCKAIKAKIDELIRVCGKFTTGGIPKGDKLCLRNGDDASTPEYEGHWTFKASESARPWVLDRDGKTPIMKEDEDEKMYPGVYVNLLVKLWPQNNEHGKRINANLIGVQFVKKGERIGSARMSEDEVRGHFGAVDGDEDSIGSIDDDPLGV